MMHDFQQGKLTNNQENTQYPGKYLSRTLTKFSQSTSTQ